MTRHSNPPVTSLPHCRGTQVAECSPEARLTSPRSHAGRGRMQTSEHILLESDEREVPALGSARKTHAQVEVTSRLRRCVLQLEIIDYRSEERRVGKECISTSVQTAHRRI